MSTAPNVAHLLLLLTVAAIKLVFCDGLITYHNRTTVATGLFFAYDMAMADFTGDSYMDVIALGPTFMQMIRGFSDGSFSTPTSINNRPGNENADVADIDGDGDQDIAVAVSSDFAQGVRESLRWLQNHGNGAFSARTLLSSGRLVGPTTIMGQTNGRDIKIADMDGDSILDIVATVSTAASVLPSLGFLMLFKNDGAGGFTQEFLAEDLGGPAILDIGDLNLDGYMDIVVLEVNVVPRTRKLRVLYGTADGSYTASVVDGGTEGTMGLSVGFLNDDEYLDILTIGFKDIVIYFGTSSGNFRKDRLVRFDTSNHKSADYRNWQIAAQDVDGDGLRDVIVVYGWNSDVRMMRQISTETFSPLEPLVPATTAGEFLLGDLDGNGVSDILVHSESQASIHAFFGLSDETPSPSLAPSVAPSPGPTESPSSVPSEFPSSKPSLTPTTTASLHPSETPTASPSDIPSQPPSSVSPSGTPTLVASANPSEVPTTIPSKSPSQPPSSHPTAPPTLVRSNPPTGKPSQAPSDSPSTENPSTAPSDRPTPNISASASPSSPPSVSASQPPSVWPSLNPTGTVEPSGEAPVQQQKTPFPTAFCIPVGSSCTQDSECCGQPSQVYCSSRCKARNPVTSKDDDPGAGCAKLFGNCDDDDRGNIRQRQRRLRGLRHSKGAV